MAGVFLLFSLSCAKGLETHLHTAGASFLSICAVTEPDQLLPSVDFSPSLGLPVLAPSQSGTPPPAPHENWNLLYKWENCFARGLR
jgi:hypothetical protein